MTKRTQKKHGKRLGDPELTVLKALWARGAATVGEVREAFLPDKPLAYTTVATMLRRMEDKGLVGHREENRAYHYHALVSERDLSQNLVGDLLHKLFDGNVTWMMSHLLTSGDVSAKELDDLETLIKERRKEQNQ